MRDSFHIKLQQYFEDLLNDKTRALLIPQTQKKTVKKDNITCVRYKPSGK